MTGKVVLVQGRLVTVQKRGGSPCGAGVHAGGGLQTRSFSPYAMVGFDERLAAERVLEDSRRSGDPRHYFMNVDLQDR